jgi:hypothetical protein
VQALCINGLVQFDAALFHRLVANFSGHQNEKACKLLNLQAFNLVPKRGLEPPRLAALVPETSASTNSATWAYQERWQYSITYARQKHLFG